MNRSLFANAALVTLPILLGGLGASAEEIVLRPRYQAGDSYALSLSAVTDAEVRSQGSGQRSETEDVQLRYEATVVILETDREGTPVRERHEGVVLTFERPGDSGSLFREGTYYEVRRENGEVSIFTRGQRVERKIEKIVADLLENQFEYTLAALVEPGRPVEIGESWELDRAAVRSFLRARGVRGAVLDGSPKATLEKRSGDGDPLAVRYRIPIASFELGAMPPNSSVARSKGSLEGEVQLASDALRRPLAHSSSLALNMNGAVYAPGSVTVPWSIRRSEAVDQRTRPVENELASTF